MGNANPAGDHYVPLTVTRRRRSLDFSAVVDTTHQSDTRVGDGSVRSDGWTRT